MGKEIQWLSFKTREQKQADLDEYTRWVFKYGQPQKEKVEQILSRLFPKEAPSMAMMTYLLGRDAYYGRYNTKKSSDRNPIKDMYDVLSKKRYQVPKKDIPLYMALIIADERVSEALDYPPDDVLHVVAARLMEQE
ncbi:MAG: hypothetical protein GX386_00525 [Clostridiaceae bacterium]|jgi:hypothetical protein|nr:hypothetical protein [Clostridiaceae bacterium]